jgi:hypothetical protein
MKQKPLPSWEYLNECFSYDPETGLLTWKHRPVEHFKSMGMYKAWNTRCVDNTITCLSKNGYLLLTLDAKNYYAHRIIYKLVTKKDPLEHIDHANGIKSDNRWRNLREATHSDNMRNRKAHKDNTCGYRGVTYHKNCKVYKFSARIYLDGEHKGLGFYKTPEEARDAYNAASDLYYGAFSYTRLADST